MTRQTARALPTIRPIVIKGLNDEQSIIFDTVMKIIVNAADECLITTVRHPLPHRKVEQKTVFVRSDLEIVFVNTTYPNDIAHHELKITHAHKIKFFLVYDNSSSDRTEVIVDQSREIGVLLKKLHYSQEQILAETAHA